MPVQDLILYQKIYDLILYSFPILEKFPKPQRWVLAQDIQKSMLRFLKYVLLAHRNYYRRDMLKKADIESGKHIACSENQVLFDFEEKYVYLAGNIKTV